MHHLLWIPKVTTSDPRHLAAVGLADHAADAQMTAIGGDKDPTGQSVGGLLVHWGPARLPGIPGPDLITLARQRRWIPAMPLDDLPAGRYAIGLDPARPPQPRELLKPHGFASSPVALGDGNLWMIPQAAHLPHDIIRNPQSGRIEQHPRPQFYAFWARCAALQRLFDQQDPQTLPSVEEQVEFLEEALRLQYRLTPELISELRLFSTGPEGTLRACLQACLYVHPSGSGGR